MRKYKKTFEPTVTGFVIFFLMFVVAAFFQVVDYFPKDTTWRILLDVAMVIVGVVVGAYLQQIVIFMTVPDKEVLHPLDKDSLFDEFQRALRDFYDKVEPSRSSKLSSDTQVYVLLNSPLLLSLEEARLAADGNLIKSQFEDDLLRVFGAEGQFKRTLISLSMTPLTTTGPAPWHRFMKAFSGFVISELFKHRCPSDSETMQEVNKCLSQFRDAVSQKVAEILNDRRIKNNFYATDEDEIQWQVIAFTSPSLRFSRAVVGFYGYDFLRKHSIFGPLGDLRQHQDSESRGFVTDEPDIVNWVIEALIRPYLENAKPGCPLNTHHTATVAQKFHDIFQDNGRTREDYSYVSNSQKRTISLEYEKSKQRSIVEFDYPDFGSPLSKTIKLNYLPGLFHPILGESSLWTSELINHQESETLMVDMCCGTGVQGITALQKGFQRCIFLDEDPLAVLATSMNLLKIFGDDAKNRASVSRSKNLSDPSDASFDAFELALEEAINRAQDKQSSTGVALDWTDITNYISANRERLSELFNPDLSSDWKQANLVMLDPPYVDYMPSNQSKPLSCLVDPNFSTVRALLEQVETAARAGQLPYGCRVVQSFSSLESCEDLEEYLSAHEWTITNCLKQNRHRAYWVTYFLEPPRGKRA